MFEIVLNSSKKDASKSILVYESVSFSNIMIDTARGHIRNIISISILFTAWCMAYGEPTATPNVLLIIADDLGAGDLSGLNPESKISTPNVDKLIQESLVFTDAHSASSIGSLARYGLMTGRYCWRSDPNCHTLMGFDLPLIPEGRWTLGDLFQRKGYRSAYLGKWGLGLGWVTKEGKVGEWEAGYSGTGESLNIDFAKPVKGGPTALGFDYFYGLAGSLDMPPYAYIENDTTVGIPFSISRAGGRSGLTVEGFRVVEVMPNMTEKTAGFLKRQAIKSKESEKSLEPFFLVVSMTAPHVPFVPTDEFAGTSKAGRYGDSVAMVDWSVGKILQSLEKHGFAKDTLVIFTSDNGAAKSNEEMVEPYNHRPGGKFRGKKGDAWEGGHRVPLIVKWPGVVKPGVSDAVISQTDLFATFAQILEMELGDNVAEDSLSFYPLLKGDSTEEVIRNTIIHYAAQGRFAIREGKWKLILPPEKVPAGIESENSGELYNLESDLSEKSNLWQNQPALVERLRKLLEKYRTLDRTRQSS